MRSSTPSNPIEHVGSLDEWQRSIQTLGTGDHLATAWAVNSPEEAKQLPIKETSPGYVSKEILPEDAKRAAFVVAQHIGRFALHTPEIKRDLATFGTNHDVTGLHADINFSNDKAKSPAITTLYIARGAIRAYFRRMPLEALAPDIDLIDEFFNEVETTSTRSHNGAEIREDRKHLFADVVLPSGSVIAFPAAGDLSRGIAAVAHQIETVPSDDARVSVSVGDTTFTPRSLSS